MPNYSASMRGTRSLTAPLEARIAGYQKMHIPCNFKFN